MLSLNLETIKYKQLQKSHIEQLQGKYIRWYSVLTDVNWGRLQKQS